MRSALRRDSKLRVVDPQFYLERAVKRLIALIDLSAWVLILPAVVFLSAVDPAMIRTMLEWTSYALVLAGVAIVVSRVTFHQIRIDDLIGQVRRGNRAAATVIASIVVFVGIVFLALVMWAKT